MPKQSDTIPYYPHPRYLDPVRKLAPEQYPKAALVALAKAHQLAVAKGHIRPEVADLMLPNVLVEGPDRADSYAANFSSMEDERKRKSTPIYKDLNSLRADYLQRSAALEAEQKGVEAKYAPGLASKNPILWRMNHEARTAENTAIFNKYLPQQIREAANQQEAANRAFIVLQEKQKQFKEDADPLDVIQRWNGYGPPGSTAEKMTVNHRQKVETLQGMLQDPSNTAIREFYQQELAKAAPSE